ncbi:hypothetical protein WJ438_21500 [Streptomyces sp. GD-15H]|uniref:hypothetical protein n=1 Tax=Streptomyces sp. GD-15H TaxID=3129112 RepID=UPI00324C01D2
MTAPPGARRRCRAKGVARAHADDTEVPGGSLPARHDWREESVLPPPRELPPSDADLVARMRAGDDTADDLTQKFGRVTSSVHADGVPLRNSGRIKGGDPVPRSTPVPRSAST